MASVSSCGSTQAAPNNSLQLTRLACGKLEGDLPAKLRENGATDARAAGQLSSRPLARSVSQRMKQSTEEPSNRRSRT
jgi:hypothetical protein